MRIAIIGQQAFGKAALDAFLARGDEVAGVFVAPEPPGVRPDPLRVAAEANGIPVFQFDSYTVPEPATALRSLGVDIGIMAFVTEFVPQSFCRIPQHGMIQFHPSLLPEHRGAASLSWAIISGRKETGLTIFRPVDGWDEGPVVLQKRVEIAPDDTLGSLYFDKIFPAGIAALLQAADAVVGGTATETPQDETMASYEGKVEVAESRINWASHVDLVYDLIRGCNPSPGAWTMWGGRRLQIFDARKRTARNFAAVRGKKPGQVVTVTPESVSVMAQGGAIEVLRCRLDDGSKIAGGAAGLTSGVILGA
ncbi:MAG: methionyl-tRNA formyltransferase [Rhodospirillales bacterium]|nr:methionyl-tRNA formyltransferase [Rhodospirillales bacterium]